MFLFAVIGFRGRSLSGRSRFFRFRTGGLVVIGLGFGLFGFGFSLFRICFGLFSLGFGLSFGGLFRAPFLRLAERRRLSLHIERQGRNQADQESCERGGPNCSPRSELSGPRAHYFPSMNFIMAFSSSLSSVFTANTVEMWVWFGRTILAGHFP
jgi:hypothetical protein